VTSRQPCDLKRAFGDSRCRPAIRYTRSSPREPGVPARIGPGSESGFLDNQNPKASFAGHAPQAPRSASGTLLLEETSFLVADASRSPHARNCPNPASWTLSTFSGWEPREGRLVRTVRGQNAANTCPSYPATNNLIPDSNCCIEHELNDYELS